MPAAKCRVWWPMPLSSGNPPSDLLLFGWCFESGPNILDVVVSSGIPANDVDGVVLKEAIQHANGKVPRSLQECSVLSLLGHCTIDLTMKHVNLRDTSDKMHVHVERVDGDTYDPGKREEMLISSDGESHREHDQLLCEEACTCNSEHYGLTMNLEQKSQTLIQNGHWIPVHFNRSELLQKKLTWIPSLNHLHWKGKLFFISHLHVYHTV